MSRVFDSGMRMMTEPEARIECMRLAVSIASVGMAAKDIVALAEAFFNFISKVGDKVGQLRDADPSADRADGLTLPESDLSLTQ